MNRKLQLTLAFSAGVLFGGLVIYHKMEDQMNETINNEIEDIKAFYAERNGFKPDNFVADEDFEEETLNDMVKLSSNYKAEDNVDYTAYSKGTVEEEMAARGLASAIALANDDEYEPDDELPERRNLFDAKEPYTIAFDGVGVLENYDQQTLTYYPDADELVDERDEPVENVDFLVGKHFRDDFGHMSENDNIVYIRNEGISMEFEIIRTSDDYADILLRTLGEEYEDVPSREPMNESSH